MALQAWQETLVTSTTDGPALSASTTQTSIIPVASKYTLPANYLQIGRMLRVTVQGRISTRVTGPDTITFDLKAGSTVIATSGALSLNTAGKTNVSFMLDWVLTCRAIGTGTSTTFMHLGTFTSEAVVGAAANTTLTTCMPVSAPAVGTGIDATSSQALDLFATFSNATTNALTVHQYRLESTY